MHTEKKTSYISGLRLIIAFILIRTLNQILFKKVAMGPGGISYIDLLSDYLFYISIFVFFAQAVIWISALKYLPLSFAYPFTSLTFITILISGMLFFGESITLGNLIGASVIMIGVALIARDHQATNTNLPNR